MHFMDTKLAALNEALHSQLRDLVHITSHPDDGELSVNTPWTFDDGDGFQIYVRHIGESIRLTDLAHTYMQLSYEINIDTLENSETRRALLQRALDEHNIVDKNGELCTEVRLDSIGEGIFRMTRAIEAVYALRHHSLNRTRNQARSTFIDDLERDLRNEFRDAGFETNFAPLKSKKASYYKADFKLDTADREVPALIFGVHNSNKARLTSISLYEFILQELKFRDIVVVPDRDQIGRADYERLDEISTDVISRSELNVNLGKAIRERISAHTLALGR